MGRRVAILAVLLAACNSIGKLRPLDEISDLKGLARAFDTLPNERGHVVVDNVRLGYRLTKLGPAGRTIVFVHGVLSDIRTWQFLAGNLGTDHRLLLIDLMGCGTSDKPDPDSLPPGAYSPDRLARQVLEVIRKKARGRVTIVGHSLGGAIILRVLGSPTLRAEFPEVVGRIDRAVLLAGVGFSVERLHPVFERVIDTPDVFIAIGSKLGIVGDIVAQDIYKGSARPQRMPREEATRMAEVLANSASRHAAQAMIRNAAPYTKDRRPSWPAIEQLVADYENITIPTLVVWGGRDELFSSAIGYRLAAQIPNAWLHIFPRETHKLPGEAPNECAELIREFTASGGRGRPRVVD